MVPQTTLAQETPDFALFDTSYNATIFLDELQRDDTRSGVSFSFCGREKGQPSGPLHQHLLTPEKLWIKQTDIKTDLWMDVPTFIKKYTFWTLEGSLELMCDIVCFSLILC